MFDMKKMKIFLRLKSRGIFCVALVFIISAVTCSAQSKAKSSATTETARFPARAVSKIKFSSVFTKLDFKSCKLMWKRESDTDEIPLICKGYKGYKVYVPEHGVLPPISIGREISTDMDSWDASTLPWFTANQAGNGQVIEWRLADGEPFACIVRAEYDKQIFFPDEKGRENSLVIKNLNGFAPINLSVDALKNKHANREARRLADAAFRKL